VIRAEVEENLSGSKPWQSEALRCLFSSTTADLVFARVAPPAIELFHDHQGQDVWVSRLREDRTLVVLFASESAPVHTVRKQINAVRGELADGLNEKE
jgi:hypothetical protein